MCVAQAEMLHTMKARARRVPGEGLMGGRGNHNRSNAATFRLQEMLFAVYSDFFMGQQLRTVAKRRRRIAYLERKKDAAKLAAVTAKSKK